MSCYTVIMPNGKEVLSKVTKGKDGILTIKKDHKKWVVELAEMRSTPGIINATMARNVYRVIGEYLGQEPIQMAMKLPPLSSAESKSLTPKCFGKRYNDECTCVHRTMCQQGTVVEAKRKLQMIVDEIMAIGNYVDAEGVGDRIILDGAFTPKQLMVLAVSVDIIQKNREVDRLAHILTSRNAN